MDCFSNKQSGFGFDFFSFQVSDMLRHNYHMITSLYPWCVCVCAHARVYVCVCAYVFDMVLYFIENVFYMDIIINMTL